MRFLILVALFLSLLVTIFAVQNNQPTTVKFLAWSVDGSSALVLMVTLILGILIGVMLMVPGSVRGRLRAGELRRSLRELEEQHPTPTDQPDSPPPTAEQPDGPSSSIDPPGPADG